MVKQDVDNVRGFQVFLFIPSRGSQAASDLQVRMVGRCHLASSRSDSRIDPGATESLILQLVAGTYRRRACQ
jgi:hypothetical protein